MPRKLCDFKIERFDWLNAVSLKGSAYYRKFSLIVGPVLEVELLSGRHFSRLKFEWFAHPYKHRYHSRRAARIKIRQPNACGSLASLSRGSSHNSCAATVLLWRCNCCAFPLHAHYTSCCLLSLHLNTVSCLIVVAAFGLPHARVVM